MISIIFKVSTGSSDEMQRVTKLPLVDVDPVERDEIIELMAFDKLPSNDELNARADILARKIFYLTVTHADVDDGPETPAVIYDAPRYLASFLEIALREQWGLKTAYPYLDKEGKIQGFVFN